MENLLKSRGTFSNSPISFPDGMWKYTVSYTNTWMKTELNNVFFSWSETTIYLSLKLAPKQNKHQEEKWKKTDAYSGSMSIVMSNSNHNQQLTAWKPFFAAPSLIIRWILYDSHVWYFVTKRWILPLNSIVEA